MVYQYYNETYLPRWQLGDNPYLLARTNTVVLRFSLKRTPYATIVSAKDGAKTEGRCLLLDTVSGQA